MTKFKKSRYSGIPELNFSYKVANLHHRICIKGNYSQYYKNIFKGQRFSKLNLYWNIRIVRVFRIKNIIAFIKIYECIS